MVFSIEVIKNLPGYVSLLVEGSVKELSYRFDNEGGGHRFQRIPPSERRGRVHSSTISVAVLTTAEEETIVLDTNDVIEQRYSGTGKGGQHRNKHQNCVRLIHRLSGLRVQVEGRMYHQNKQVAWQELRRRFEQAQTQSQQAVFDADRRLQMGTGQRGDKRRTCSIQRDIVEDHIDGWKLKWSKYMRGYIKD